MAYGYRESEHHKIPKYVKFNATNPYDVPGMHNSGFFMKGNEKIYLDQSIKITRITPNRSASRTVVQSSLGMHVDNAAMPHVDPTDTATAMAGSLFRFGRHVPIKKNLRGFKRFVKNWLKKNLTPLDVTSDTSFDAWIAKTPYTESRKNELRRKYKEMGIDNYDLPDRLLKVKSFIKDETYETFKHARGINSRSDEFKCAVGPIFQLISDAVFALPWFIKKIPIHLRPQYIIDRLFKIGATYRTTDYTSYEAHFTPELKRNCEFLLYEHMVQFLPGGMEWLKLVKRSGAETANHIDFKCFSMEIDGKRMSGEMDTSLANGFANLMLMLYLCEVNRNTNVIGVIEGDDGLFTVTGTPPSADLFKDFGLTIKIVDFNELNHASFCGMLFDLDDRTNVSNPIEVLVGFGWTTARYSRSSQRVHNHLLRAKALSLAYQYPACPILSALAYKVCQLTAGYDTEKFLSTQGNHAFCQYEMEIIQQSLAHLKTTQYFTKNNLLAVPGIKTRLLVEELYGVTVADQLTIEDHIVGLKTISKLNIPVLNKYLHSDWVEYFDRYTIEYPYQEDFDNLLTVWPQVRQPARFYVNRR
jgi:hypothetical protein